MVTIADTRALSRPTISLGNRRAARTQNATPKAEVRTTFNIRLYALRSSGSRPADATRARSRTWLPAMVLASCALLATVATSSTSAAHTPYLTVQALSAGRVKITLAGNPPRGRLDFSVDGHRIRRTRGHSITVRPPRTGWHRVAVRRVGAPRLLARTRFALGARSYRSAPTLVLLTALPTKSTVPTAVLRFSASTGNVTCQQDMGAFKPCTSPTSYLDLTPGRHRFTIRAMPGNRQTIVK